MVLNRERIDVETTKTFDHLVVEAVMAHLDTAESLGGIDDGVDRRVDGKAVIVRGDFNATGRFVENGLVDSAVTVFEFERFETQCTTEKLIAETYPEKRNLPFENSPQNLDVSS